MYAASKLILREAKIKNAEKVKEEKRRWKEEKLLREKEKSDLVKKKNQEINDLEVAFLQELTKKKEKEEKEKEKEKEKEEKFFMVKSQKAKSRIRYMNSESSMENKSIVFNEAAESSIRRKGLVYNEATESNIGRKGLADNQGSERLVHLESSTEGIYETPKRAQDKIKSENLLDTRKPSNIKTNASDYYNLNTKYAVGNKSQENYLVNRPRDSNDMRFGSPFKSGESLLSIQRSEFSDQRKLREKRKKVQRKTFLPLILKPIGNGVLTVHILNDSKPVQSKSENTSPAKGLENQVHKPYFHMFRDVETIHKSNNLIPESKLKVMQDYDKLVKRNYTPKPDLNYNLRLESKKLGKYLENTVKRVKFLKIF